mgnify:CR=1 FL=1
MKIALLFNIYAFFEGFFADFSVNLARFYKKLYLFQN